MRIGIDGRLYNESGVGRYIRNLLKNLQEIDSNNEYFVFLLPKDYEQLNFKKNFTKVLANFKWYGLAEQTKFPGLLKKYNLDLVHFPHFNIPIFYRGRFVVTIHDLIHHNFQMKRASTHSLITYGIKRLGYMKVFMDAINKSQKVITPSDYVKDLLVKDCKVPGTKVVVTHEAVDDKLVSINAEISKAEEEAVIKKFNIKLPYIFYVGNAHPHKNLDGLIKAFLHLRQKRKNLKLVLSGGDHYFWQKIKMAYSDPNIIYTGYISENELVALYRKAQAYIMPSLEEGFGIPLLEAMACGVPVISSNAASLPEVGGPPVGGAAIYFDPKNTEDMVNKIGEVLDNKDLRKQLIEKGKERYKKFSWKKLAEQTLEVYESSNCS